MCKYSDGNILNITTIKIDARPEMSFMYKYRVNVKDCHPSHLLMYEIRFVGRAGFIKRSFPYEAEGSVCNLCMLALYTIKSLPKHLLYDVHESQKERTSFYIIYFV